MSKTVYYAKSPDDTRPSRPQRPAPAARRGKRMGLVIMTSCLAVALMCVVLVPLLTGGAAPASTAAQDAGEKSAVSYGSARQALDAIGISAALPTALPEGCTVTSCQVVDGTMLELGIQSGSGMILFRAAAGTDDLSGADYSGYTTTETAGGITREYAGVSDKKLNAAVWTKGSCSYALVAENALEADLMRRVAESIV